LDESCISNPKSEISNWTRSSLIFRISDLRCRIRPISKFLAILLAFALSAITVRLWPKPSLASRYTSSVAVFDAHGTLLRLALADDDRYRLWLRLDEIGPDLVEAFLLQEDRWFYRHPGVNPPALARAAWRTYAGVGPRQGGSTITMQLARLMSRRNTRTAGRKLAQIGQALALELMYSKREILEAYLNLVPFGGNVEGVGAASLIHFGKPVRALSLPETLTLAVIPQSPARRALRRGTADAIVDARLRLFDRWQKSHPGAEPQRGLMTLALNLRRPADLPFTAPHAVNALLAGQPARGPREIRATLDSKLQRIVERQVRSYVIRNRRIGIENAAAILVDFREMEVKAVVGSADFFNDAIDGQVNSTLAKRSPGSTLKPFVYALAMDQGLIHPLTVLKDAPASFGPFSPENFDGRFAGPITAHDALIRSRNVPAVALSSQLSGPSLYEFLKTAGVARLAPERHYGLALALGSGDVTMEELATLYGVLANRGVWHPLRSRVTDPKSGGAGLLSEEASFMTLEILRSNPRPEGSMMGARVNVPVAWKTGTSWGFRDAWSAGIFGPYVLVAWVGNFSGEGNPAFVGATAAAPLFFQIVDAITAEAPELAGTTSHVPANLARVEVCAATGDLPNSHCPLLATTWFVPGKSPIRVSEVHRPVTTDRRTGRVACPPYDPRFVKTSVYEYWSSDLMQLFAQAGMPRRAPPAGECPGVAAHGMRPAITAPVRGSSYVMRESQPERNVVPLAANADAGVGTLYWFVNESFVGAGKPNAAFTWKPTQPGSYIVRVVDDRGRADLRELTVDAAP
jgi:penicillin-binding protein 1C